ncbi:hypothetical protein [Streptomyces sp. NPDC017940]
MLGELFLDGTVEEAYVVDVLVVPRPAGAESLRLGRSRLGSLGGAEAWR